MNMKFKIEKHMLCLRMFVLCASVFSIIYSCTSDDYPIMDNDIHSSENAKTRSLAITNNKDSLLAVIAESDEFIDFLISARQLTEKLDVYKASLNQKELNEYAVEDIFEKVDIENELRELEKSRNKLRRNTLFLELGDIERFQLFSDYENMGRSLLKNKEEGNKKDKCEKILQEGYDKAQTLYDIYVACCESKDFVKCVREAARIRDDARDRAEYDYLVCMGIA